ncbi:MAG: 1-acyl-sn-glycerol-3-phosphate acyltransferase [Thermoplasmata archaeon]
MPLDSQDIAKHAEGMEHRKEAAAAVSPCGLWGFGPAFGLIKKAATSLLKPFSHFFLRCAKFRGICRRQAGWMVKALACKINAPEVSTAGLKGFLIKAARVLVLNTFALLIATPFLKLLNSFEARGRWNIPKDGPFLLLANHISALDPFILGYGLWLRRFDLSIMAKAELFEIPIVGSLIRAMGAYPVRRGQRDMGAIDETLARLKEGMPLLLFPEGTRTRDGCMGRGRIGVGRIVHLAGVPVVPAVINGSHKLVPVGAMLPRLFTRLEVVYGEPIHFSQYKGMENTPEISRAITDEIMARIKKLAEESFSPETTPYAWSEGRIPWREEPVKPIDTNVTGAKVSAGQSSDLNVSYNKKAGEEASVRSSESVSLPERKAVRVSGGSGADGVEKPLSHHLPHKRHDVKGAEDKGIEETKRDNTNMKDHVVSRGYSCEETFSELEKKIKKVSSEKGLPVAEALEEVRAARDMMEKGLKEGAVLKAKEIEDNISKLIEASERLDNIRLKVSKIDTKHPNYSKIKYHLRMADTYQKKASGERVLYHCEEIEKIISSDSLPENVHAEKQ